MSIKSDRWIRRMAQEHRIIVNVTPLEPEWEGHVTLEFSNTSPLPNRRHITQSLN